MSVHRLIVIFSRRRCVAIIRISIVALVRASMCMSRLTFMRRIRLQITSTIIMLSVISCTIVLIGIISI